MHKVEPNYSMTSGLLIGTGRGILCFQTQKSVELRAKRLVRLVEESRQFIIICRLNNHASKYARAFFLSTLGVETMLVRWTLKNTSGSSTFEPDHGLTGRSPANKTPSVVRQHTIDFLKKFPTMPSHYCRRDTNLMYLEPGLTVPKLYQLYKQEIDKEKNAEFQ